MKLVLYISVATLSAEAWLWQRQPVRTTRPKPMSTNYGYSTNSDQYLQQRQQDTYKKPYLGGTYSINPKWDYQQQTLQKPTNLVYRHPDLDKSNTPGYIPTNRVNQPRKFLPPPNFSYGSKYPVSGSVSNRWLSRNKYSTSRGNSRFQPWAQTSYKKYEDKQPFFDSATKSGSDFWGADQIKKVIDSDSSNDASQAQNMVEAVEPNTFLSVTTGGDFEEMVEEVGSGSDIEQAILDSVVEDEEIVEKIIDLDESKPAAQPAAPVYDTSCPSGQQWDWDYKRCVYLSGNSCLPTEYWNSFYKKCSKKNSSWTATPRPKPVYTTTATNTISRQVPQIQPSSNSRIAQVTSTTAKGPSYYDWATRSYKNCNVGEVYSWRSKSCQVQVQRSRWSFFG